MSLPCFETTNVKNKSIVRLLSGFAFKNNFTFTKVEHLGLEEIKIGCALLLLLHFVCLHQFSLFTSFRNIFKGK